MAETRSRRDPNPQRPRTRVKSTPPVENGDLVSTEPESEVRTATETPPESINAPPEEEFVGFDEEVNNRYEEIKRGSTHISELQQMTMPQLLKTAKEEGISDYTGLKKQDLIFKILKERVKQNGLMFG